MKSRLVQWMFFSFMVTVVTHQSYAIEWPHFNPSALQPWSQTAQQLNSLVAASQSTTDTLQDEINQLAHIDLKKFDDMLKSYGVRIDHLETDKASTQYVDQQVKTLNTDLGTKVTNTQYEADKTQLSQDIAANKQALTGKVSQSTYDARVTKVDQQLGKHAQDLNAWINGGKVTDAKGKEITVPSIADNQTALASKVAQSDFDKRSTAVDTALAGKVADATYQQDKTALARQIADKVDASTYQTDKTQLDQDIAANKQALADKVSQSTYHARVTKVDQQLGKHAQDLKAWINGGKVTDAKGKEITVPSIADNQTALASKVAQSDFDKRSTAVDTALAGKVADATYQQDKTALARQIADKVDASTYQTDKTQLDQDIAANKHALTGKVSQAAYDQDQGVVNQKITQKTTSIESEQVNTLHMLKGGLVSTASGNVTLNNGLQTIDQEIDKIRASAVGDKVCTPMTGQALLTDLQSAACNNIILYKQAYVLPTYYVSIANKHIYAATRMPVTITAKNVGHFDIGGQVSLEGVHLALKYLMIYGRVMFKDDLIDISNSATNLWYQKLPGGITVSKNATLTMINTTLVMAPPAGSYAPLAGQPFIGIYSPYESSFVLLDNTRIVMDPEQVYPNNTSSEYRAVVINSGK